MKFEDFARNRNTSTNKTKKKESLSSFENFAKDYMANPEKYKKPATQNSNKNAMSWEQAYRNSSEAPKVLTAEGQAEFKSKNTVPVLQGLNDNKGIQSVIPQAKPSTKKTTNPGQVLRGDIPQKVNINKLEPLPYNEDDAFETFKNLPVPKSAQEDNETLKKFQEREYEEVEQEISKKYKNMSVEDRKKELEQIFAVLEPQDYKKINDIHNKNFLKENFGEETDDEKYLRHKYRLDKEQLNEIVNNRDILDKSAYWDIYETYENLSQADIDRLDKIREKRYSYDFSGIGNVVRGFQGISGSGGLSYAASVYPSDLLPTKSITMQEAELRRAGYTEEEIDKLLNYHEQVRSKESSQKMHEVDTDYYPVLNSLTSVATNLAAPIMTGWEWANAKLEGRPVNPYSYGNQFAQKTTDLRQSVKDEYDLNVNLPWFGEKDLFDFVYDAGMSTVDSLVASAIMPTTSVPSKILNKVDNIANPVAKWFAKQGIKGVKGLTAGAVVGSEAAASTINEVQKRGGNENEALSAGVVAYLAEALTEAYSIGEFKGMQESGKRGLYNFAVDLVKSSGVNASEEMIAEAVNIAYDVCFLGENGDFEQNVKAYMQTRKPDGTYYTREEAEKLAWEDSLKQIAESGISGAFQGTIMGGTANASNRVSRYVNDAKTGKAVKSEGLTDAVVEAGRTSNDKLVQEYVDKINKKGVDKASNVEIGSVARELMKGGETTDAALETIGSYTRPINLLSTEKVQITHPTLGKADGKVVSLSSVESVNNGNITVKNSNGETQTLDLNKLKGKAKELWSYAAETFTDPKAVEGFVNGYEGGSVDTYSDRFKDVFNLASVGMTAEQIKKEGFFGYNTLGQKAFESAVELGNNAMSYKEGVVNLTTKRKTASQKLIMKMADEFGKRHGMNITFVDTLGSKEGFYKPNSNQIVIALDGSRGAIARTLGHETYHYVEQQSGVQAGQISDFVIDTLTNIKGKEWVESRYAFYEKQGYKTLDKQKSELVADQMFEVFANERAVNEFVAKDRTLAQRVLDHIKGLIAEIKNIYKNLVASGQYEDIAAWQEDLKALEKVNDMMLDALANIEQRKNTGQKAEKNTAEAVTMSTNRTFSYKELTSKPDIKLTALSESVPTDANGKINRGILVDKAIQNVKTIGHTNKNGNGEVFVKDVGRNVAISKASVRHGIDRRVETQAPVLMHIGEVISNSIEINRLTPKKNTASGSYILLGAAKDGDNIYVVSSVVNRYTNSIDSIDVLYSANIKKESAVSKTRASGMSLQSLTDSTISVSDLLEIVKDKNPEILSNDVLKHFGLTRGNGEIESALMFSAKRLVEETKDLIAVHNMQESELLKTLQLGGFPMPSIAIIKAQQGHSEYGPVSVVFNKSTIDPKANKNNKVYGGDAWTPTYPTIEYKVNDKVQKKISNLYYELYRKYGADEARSLYNYVNDMERQLNTNRGEAGMIENLKDDERLMQLYLLQSGKGKIEPVIKQTVTELSQAEVEMYDYLISAIGKDVITEFKTPPGKKPLQYRTEFYEKNGEKIENAYKQMLRDNFGFTDEQIDNVISNMKKGDFVNLIRQTYQYMANGKTTIKEDIDGKATSEAIRNAIKDSGFNQWVDGLFKGVEEKSGIRNNADYFTSSGNRRSWEALHWENTLENVVKVMKSQNNGVAAFFSGHAIWGVSAKDYKSIEEIKADSDRLKAIPQEKYDAIKEGFGMRLNEIATSIMDKSESNQFIAADNAMQCIVEAVRNSKTKSGILNELRQYRQLDVTETAVDDIVSLVSDISNMPTEYFEAKPQRAVGLDEIAYVVVPDTSTELVNTLNERGIETRTYISGDEADRVKALNSDESVLFSTKRDADYMTAVENGDMKTAQRMVDEVAKENGYTPEHLYHGTNEFGFTSFDMGNSDDGISFFMSDKQSVSQGYMSYNNNSTDAYHNAPRRIGKKSDMKRTALSRTSSVDKVIDTLKKQFPYYAEARQATESDVVSYLQKDISVNDAVSSANELLKLDLLDDVRALAESVVKASEDGSYNAWKNVADKYSEFDDVYDVTENIRQWNRALDLWDNIKRGVYTASDIVQEDSVYHNGKVESKSALIKRYNNSLQGESNGMYDLYANHSNQLVIEGNGSYWIDLPLGKMAQQYNDWWVNVKGNPALEGAIYTNGDTRSISEFAKAMGYHSVRFNNIYDSGASEGSGELSTVYSFFYPSQDIKSADPVTYDDDGEVIPLSERFNEAEPDIRYSAKRYWKPDMPKADFQHIRRIAKNELKTTDNYLDNITKWLYNKKNGQTYFALYSTVYEDDPTILYASIGDQANAEHSLVMSYLNELGDESDDGKTKTFNEILEDLKNTFDLRTVHRGVSSNRRNGHRDVSVHSGASRSGLSRALLNCLQDSYERRRSVENEQKYSTKREMSVSEDASDYILDTKEYQDILKIVDQRYNLTNKKNLSPKAVERLAGKLLSNSKSKYDKGALTERLSALFDYMANSNELVWEDVMKTAAEISHDILSQSSSLDRSMQNQYKDTLDYLKGLTVYISPEVRAEIDNRYGSLENYRRMLGGKTKITVTDSSKMSLDSLWRELNEYHPEMFDADVSSLDQAEELMNFFDMTKPTYVNQFEYYWDMNEASYDFALQIYEEYFNIPEVVTESQRHKLEMERLKGKQNAKIAQIRKEYKDRIKRIRAEKNSKIEATKELYRERNRQYREKRNDTAERQKLRRQIVRETKKLTDKLVNPTDKKHIPQELIVGINSFAKAMTEHGAFPAQRAAKLQQAFKNIGEKSTDPDFNIASMYDEEIEAMLDNLTLVLSNKRLGEMTSTELTQVRDIARYFSRIVSMSNQAFSDGIKENLSELQTSTFDEVASQSKDKKRMMFKMQTGLLKPVTFFEILESPTLEKLYTNIRKGEESWARTVLDAKQKRIDAQEKYGYKKWADDKVDITTERGDKLSISVKEALSIYATSKRKQGVEHIMKGGIVLEEEARKQLEKKNRFSKNKDKSVNVRSANIPLSLADIQNINSSLTEEQKAYADELVRYMSSDMAKLGNEVSMKLYGIQKYNEDYYFPLKSASNFLYSEPGVENDSRIKHMSMTKRTVPKANNPVVIGNFTETAMSHCNDMALYYGFTLPLEDFKRVWNYKTPTIEGTTPSSIKQQIDMVYGDKANKYIKQMLTDINGGVTKQAGADVVNRMISLAKKNAVFASLSVAVQQPSAIARSLAYIDPKYFVGHQKKGTWAEIKKYAPVAIIKEMGYFDTGIGRQAVDWMTETEYNRLKEKAFALFKDSNYRDDVLSFLPSYMDEISWGRIWVAVKNETKAKHPDLDVKSEEFLNKVGERFTYVIDRTQVYDSVFSRSEWMRSKDTGMKVATAFMAEPLTNYNLLYNAAIKAKNGDKKFAARALVAYAVSVAFNSMLKSFVTAARNDDDDEYWRKYLSAFLGALFDEPLGMIPYFKDLFSLLKGYDSNRMDTQVLADIAGAIKTLTSDKKHPYEKVKSVVSAVGVATGIPFKNLWREAEMILKVFGFDINSLIK